MLLLDGFIVDEDRYNELKMFRWKPGKDGYAQAKSKRVWIKMHRIVIGAKEGEIVDHINGNVKDNRYENLRIVDHYQNSANRRRVEGGTSQYKGVYRYTQKVKKENMIYEYTYWWAKLKKEGKVVYRQRFNTEFEAAKAYDEQAIKWHGEYARLNFPQLV